MSSADKGKDIAIRWIKENVLGGMVLDVGACDGKYGKILRYEYYVDAVEVFEPNITKHNLCEIYENVFNVDIRNYLYTCQYDLVIFGDVLEHMTEAEAIKVLENAKAHSGAILVAVPFMWEQGEIYGNPYERHVQDRLTHEKFMATYEGFEPLVIYPNYGYYVWRCDK